MMQRLFLLILLFMNSPLIAQSPILPMNYSSRTIPFLDDSLRDPSIVKRQIRDDIAFEQAMEDISLQRQELNAARGLRRIELLESLYLSYQNISYFLVDVQNKRINVVANYSPINKKLSNVRKSANYFAVELARLTKSNKQRARAFYHLYTNRYLTTSNKSSSVRSLLKIQKHLNGYLKRRVTFLNGMHIAEYKNPKKGIKLIQSVIGSMPKLAGISGRLVIAKKKAGIQRNGRRTAKADDSYRKYLAAAAYRSRNISKDDKKKVFSFTVAVWRAVEGRKGSWTSYPFKINHFSNIPESNAMIERAAISDMKKKRYKQAIAKYTHLSRKVEGSPYAARMDMRVISLYEKRYKTHKTGVAMQKILAKYQEKYQSQSRTATYSRIRAKHAQLIQRELGKGLRKKTPKNVRSAAITVAYRYLNTFASDAEKIQIESKIARIYSINGQHSKAVAIYIALKDRTSGKQSFNFLNLAIKSQSLVAKWPRKAPWNGISKGHPKSRTYLLAMMEEKYQSTSSWSDLAHIGLIKINLGRGEEAFASWMQKIDVAPTSIHARKATGFMALAYKRSKQWQKLEDVSRMALVKKIRPIYRGKGYSAYALLGDALFFGGKELFKKQDWATSIVKLKEFTGNYLRDSRRPEGFFFLGQAFHNNANHPESIETMMTLVNSYPNSRFERKALLLGGEWSIPMAYEEQTIFFYQRFVNKFGRDRETIEVRRVLADLYIGREIYGYAARIYLDQSKDSRLSNGERLQSALAVLEVEERHGEVRHARIGAKQVKALGSRNPDAMAKVYGFEARIAGKKRDFKALKNIEAKLSRLSLDSRTVRENLAQVKLVLAQSESKKTKAKFFNLALRDPLKVMDQQYALFLDVKKRFEGVCNLGQSSYCAPAMMMLSETTKNTLTSIEDLTIPQTLAEQTVAKFEERKLSIIAYLDQVARQSDTKALGISEEGETTPDWSRQVQWTNDEEISFDQSNSSAGNGFVQWSPVIQQATDSFGADLGDSSW